MHKVIWLLWLQGIDQAPFVVKKCIQSWITKNPGWDIRILDKTNIHHYIELPDLSRKDITTASFSDVIRIYLLKEYGGIWIDSTVFCNIPLDQWVYKYLKSGFFAFDGPANDRLISTWFIAAEEHNILINKWLSYTNKYWKDRNSSNTYFWFHYLFNKLVNSDDLCREIYLNMPKMSSDFPHSAQKAGLLKTFSPELGAKIDWTSPVFKFTHKFHPEDYSQESLLAKIIEFDSPKTANHCSLQSNECLKYRKDVKDFKLASLKVSTKNIGDHIQIIAAQNLLKRFGYLHSLYVDRDDELNSLNNTFKNNDDIFILLNGWFKSGNTEWPPNLNFLPVFFSFHLRPHQCPALLSNVSIEYLKKNEPIGCRDIYTYGELRSRGVNAFVSNCLTTTFPVREKPSPDTSKIFIISRDRRILNHLPKFINKYTFISHYSDSNDFDLNLKKGRKLLNTYKNEANLIITTLLHAALPAMSMGIPVVLFYPINNKKGHKSDKQRFSSIAHLIDICDFDHIDQVNWSLSQWR